MATGCLSALLLAPAQAQPFWFNPDRVTAPWCLAHSDLSGSVECSFYTFAQCQETRLGVGGSCQPNPAYRASAAHPRGMQRYR
jgi:hypothetical protein